MFCQLANHKRSFKFALELDNVSVELIQDSCKDHPEQDTFLESIASLELKRSQVAFDVFKDDLLTSQGFSFKLISHLINAHDTRKYGQEFRGNLFTAVLTPSDPSASISNPNDTQLEIHFNGTPLRDSVHIILNKCRMVVAPDWLLMVKNFVLTLRKNVFSCVELNRNREVQGASKPSVPLDLTVSITSPEFLLVQDCAKFETNALVLKFCAVIKLTFLKFIQEFEVVSIDNGSILISVRYFFFVDSN